MAAQDSDRAPDARTLLNEGHPRADNDRVNHPPRPQGSQGRPAVALATAFATAACLALPVAALAQRPGPALVPQPAEIAAVDGAATLGPSWKVRVPVASPADSFAAALLIDDVRVRFGWTWSVTTEETAPAVVLRPSRPSHRGTAVWNRQ